MILTDAYFEDIQATIKRELLMARRNVYVAVAWFTDEILFNTLLELQSKNVSIQLCIIEDEINFKDYGLPFKKLVGEYGKFYGTTTDNMHHKFCVIDESVVITGSYNWTYKAANSGKDENIIVTSGDWELAQKFIKEFYKITGQTFTDEKTDLNRILKRCTAILNLLQLDEVEDVHKQAQRLQVEATSLNEVISITQHLLQNRFANAIEEINVFVKKYQSLKVYEDPLINALKLEIKLLEYQLIDLENERSDAEKKVFEYDRLFNEILGETVKKYLELKKKLKQFAIEEDPESETAKEEYEDAQKDYFEFNESYEETKEQNKNFKQLKNPQQVNELKKMYREAAMLCHPDKFINDSKKYAQAEMLFKQLNEANQKQQIDKVKLILEKIKNGIFDAVETNTKTNDLQLLKQILQQLKSKYNQIFETIHTIKETEPYKKVIEEENLHDYFKKLKIDIDEQIMVLLEKIRDYEL